MALKLLPSNLRKLRQEQFLLYLQLMIITLKKSINKLNYT